MTVQAVTLSTVLLLSLLAHACGDYLFQTEWMAVEKTRRWSAAGVHAVAYGVPFLPLLASAQRPEAAVVAGAVIVGTHLVLDRYRLARYLVWARNQLAPARYRYRWAQADPDGFRPGTPAHLGGWLVVVNDNVLHVAINTAALAWLWS